MTTSCLIFTKLRCFSLILVILLFSTPFAQSLPSLAHIAKEQIDEDQQQLVIDANIVEGDQIEGESAEEGEYEEHKEGSAEYTSDDPEFYMFIVIASVLVTFAGICSGLTVGYLGITNLQLDIILKNGSVKEKEAACSIKPVIKDHHLLLSTLLLSNAIAMEALPIFLDAVCPAWAAILISTVAVVIVGEIIPQAYCTGKHQLRIGQMFAPLTKILMKVLFIFTYPVSKALDKLLGVHDNSRLERKEDLVGLFELQELSKEELTMRGKNQSEAQRGLTKEEIKLVTSTMLLREKNVTRYMQPYAKIFKLNEKDLINQRMLEQIARKGFSNIVVHAEGNKSQIIGILKSKSLIDLVDTETNTSVKSIASLHEPIIISDQTNMLELLMVFQKKKTTVALVFESNKKHLDENVLHKLQDPQLSERIVDAKQFKGFIIGLISLKDVFEVMISKDLEDEDSH